MSNGHCPYHLSLPSLSLSLSRLTWAVPRMYSLLILSSFVTPSEYLSIFKSAISSSFYCPLLNATVSKLYTKAGFITVLYTFPFIITVNLLSQSTPVTPAVPPCLYSLLYFAPALSITLHVDPRYLNSFTFATSNPSIFIVPPFPISFIHMYSVLLLLTFIPRFSNACLHLSRLASTCCLCSLQMTMSSANIMVNDVVSPQIFLSLQPFVGAYCYFLCSILDFKRSLLYRLYRLKSIHRR